MRARRGGFGGKLCIHPVQVALAHKALGPTVEELTWARRVIDAAFKARGGVVNLDGRMVDVPVVKLDRLSCRAGAAAPGLLRARPPGSRQAGALAICTHASRLHPAIPEWVWMMRHRDRLRIYRRWISR